MKCIKPPTVTPFPSESVDMQMLAMQKIMLDAIEHAQITLMDQSGTPARVRLDAIFRLERGQRALMAQVRRMRQDIDDLIYS